VRNSRFRWKPLPGAVLLLAGLAAGAWADDSLVLTSAGAGAAMGGVYTSPYGITVNGTPTLLICDDYTTDISLGQSWSAGVTTLSQVNSTTITGLKFDSVPYIANILGGAGNVVQDYATAAVLAAQLLTMPNIGTSSEDTEMAGDLSFAIWSIFDSSLLTSLNASGGTGFG